MICSILYFFGKIKLNKKLNHYEGNEQNKLEKTKKSIKVQNISNTSNISR